MTDHEHLLAHLRHDTEPYLSCDDCFARIDQYVERVIAEPRHRDLPMETHLAACGACAEEAESLRELIGSEGA